MALVREAVKGIIQKLWYRFDIWLIILAAFVVKIIGSPNMVHTNFPEFYRDYFMVETIFRGTETVLAGPPSMLGGFHFGPFYYYSMVPLFALFGTHPYGLIFTGVIFSTLTVYALFKLVLLWSGNRTTALAAAAFCAFSVYSLHLAAYVSNPNFLPLFVLWYFYHLTKVLTQTATTRRDFIFLGVAFGLATQLHATAMIVLPIVTVVALFCNWQALKQKKFAWTVLTSLVTYIPYLLYEISQNFQNIGRLFMLGGTVLRGGKTAAGLETVWNFFAGTLTPFNSWYTYTHITNPYVNGIFAIVVLICLVDFIRRVLWRDNQPQPYTKFSKIGTVIFVSWIITCISLLLLYSRAAHDHYIIILWPAPMILLALVVTWLREKWNIFASVIGCIILVSLLQIYSFYAVPKVEWSQFFNTYRAHYASQTFEFISEIGSTWQ